MRKIGPALLIVVTAATLTACTAPNDAPAPSPSASSSGPIYPDLDQFTPAPTGAIDADSGETHGPRPVPTWDEESRESATAAAVAVMTAYARPDLPFDQWWAGLQPLLDGKATQDYAYMDPARIVATSVTGPAVITDDTSAYVAFVDVPTNAGTYGVVLSRADGRLTVERGLFSRSRSSVGQRRIQAWSLHQGLLQRWLGVQQLKVDIAAGNAEDNNNRSLRELAPIARQQQCTQLIQTLAPDLAWPPPQWQPVAPRQAWRLCLPALLLWQPLLITALWQLAGSWALLCLCWLPVTVWRAWRSVGFMGYHVDAHAVMVRGGWWQRWWRMAQTAKVQGLRLRRSPLDRLCGTASLLLDTAGSSMGGPRLQLALLPVAQAQHLLEQLSARISRPRVASSTDAAAPVTQVPADLQPT